MNFDNRRGDQPLSRGTCDPRQNHHRTGPIGHSGAIRVLDGVAHLRDDDHHRRHKQHWRYTGLDQRQPPRHRVAVSRSMYAHRRHLVFAGDVIGELAIGNQRDLFALGIMH